MRTELQQYPLYLQVLDKVLVTAADIIDYWIHGEPQPIVFRKMPINYQKIKHPLKTPRKQRPAGEFPRGPVVRMTWDLAPEPAGAMGGQELTLGVLDQERRDDLSPTPHSMLQDLVPPGAPKVTVVPNPSVNMAIGGYALCGATPTPPHHLDLAADEDSDTDFLFRRQHYVVHDSLWSKLSDELVLAVFKWLPKVTLIRCARVCHRWYRLSFDESLWRRLDLSARNLKPGVIGRVLDRGTIVLRLAKSEIHEPLYNDLHECMSPKMCRIQYLDLSMAIIEPTGLQDLLSSCRFLRKLSLENCTINDNVCRAIGQNGHLEVLDLAMVQGLTESGLVPLCNGLTRLEALNVAWTGLNRGAVLYLLICLPPTLLKLNLSGCREMLLDEDVQQLCRSCPHLKELDLSDATLLTSVSVEYMASMLPGLEYLALSRCYQIAPAALPLLNNLSTLLALDVFGMLHEAALRHLREVMAAIEINKFPFSSIARPTTGIRRTSIWGLRVRDCAV